MLFILNLAVFPTTITMKKVVKLLKIFLKLHDKKKKKINVYLKLISSNFIFRIEPVGQSISWRI